MFCIFLYWSALFQSLCVTECVIYVFSNRHASTEHVFFLPDWQRTQPVSLPEPRCNIKPQPSEKVSWQRKSNNTATCLYFNRVYMYIYIYIYIYVIKFFCGGLHLLITSTYNPSKVTYWEQGHDVGLKSCWRIQSSRLPRCYYYHEYYYDYISAPFL